MLLFISATAKANPGFEIACQKLAAEAAIWVVFEDRPVSRDDSRSLETLKRLSTSGKSPYHNVLGLTHAEPTASLDVFPRFLTASDGRTCGVPSLNLKLGFSTMQVYLASELKDSCRRQIVDEHEQEHVAVWRTHVRAGAKMLEGLLRKKLAEPAYFQTSAEADEVLRQQVEALIVPLLKNLTESVEASQQQIDSPASYQYAEGRMRACP